VTVKVKVKVKVKLKVKKVQHWKRSELEYCGEQSAREEPHCRVS
jgi:hypothetical protein